MIQTRKTYPNKYIYIDRRPIVRHLWAYRLVFGTAGECVQRTIFTFANHYWKSCEIYHPVAMGLLVIESQGNVENSNNMKEKETERRKENRLKLVNRLSYLLSHPSSAISYRSANVASRSISELPSFYRRTKANGENEMEIHRRRDWECKQQKWLDFVLSSASFMPYTLTHTFTVESIYIIYSMYSFIVHPWKSILIVISFLCRHFR